MKEVIILLNYFERWLKSDFEWSLIEKDAHNMLPTDYTPVEVKEPHAFTSPDDVPCPTELSALILAAAYCKAVQSGEQDTAERAATLLKIKNYPKLYLENASETDVIAQLCQVLSIQGRSILAEGNLISGVVSSYVCILSVDAVKTADIAIAMNLESIRGEMGAFDYRLHDIARPYPGQIACAANVRRLLQGSEMVTDIGRQSFGYDTHPRVQDAICIRATPQTHGGVRDILTWCCQNVADITASGYLIEYSMNALITALADLAHISERRAFRLNDTHLSYGLPMNLVPEGVGLNHGFPVVQSNQAAFVAELKLLVLPTTAIKKTVTCLSYYAASKLLHALPLLHKVLAIELLMCAQGMDIVKTRLPKFSFGIGTQAVLTELRKTVPLMTENRFVSPDMIEVERLIQKKILLDAANLSVGPLM